MLTRALWIAVLTLLGWIPIGQARSRMFQGERSLFTVSALDVASDSPARVGERGGLPREITTDRRPPTPRGLPRDIGAAELVVPSTPPSGQPSASEKTTGWRGFREKRLILPHDATAPPPQRS